VGALNLFINVRSGTERPILLGNEICSLCRTGLFLFDSFPTTSHLKRRLHAFENLTSSHLLSKRLDIDDAIAKDHLGHVQRAFRGQIGKLLNFVAIRTLLCWPGATNETR
jgi:hypothetical protein